MNTFLRTATALLLFLAALAATAQREPTFFVRVVTDKPEVIAGDSVIVSVLLYTDAEFENVSCKTKTLRLRGADVHRRAVDRNRQRGRTALGGHVWNTMLWAQYAVCKEKPGTVKIPTMKFTATLRVYDRPADPFDEFFGRRRTYRQVETKAESEETTLSFTAKPRRTTRQLMQGGGVL